MVWGWFQGHRRGHRRSHRALHIPQAVGDCIKRGAHSRITRSPGDSFKIELHDHNACMRVVLRAFALHCLYQAADFVVDDIFPLNSGTPRLSELNPD